MDPVASALEESIAQMAGGGPEGGGADLGTPAAAEQALRGLQANRSDFHRLPIVQYINSRIDEAVRLQIQKRLTEELAKTGGQVVQGTALNVAARLSTSAPFQALQLRIMGEVQNAVDSLLAREQPIQCGPVEADRDGFQQILCLDGCDGDASFSSGASDGGYGVDLQTKKLMSTLRSLFSDNEAEFGLCPHPIDQPNAEPNVQCEP